MKDRLCVAKKLIIKFLFQIKTYFLQSSKIRTFWEMDKKSCINENFYAKNFISIHFVLIFVPSKYIDFV